MLPPDSLTITEILGLLAGIGAFIGAILLAYKNNWVPGRNARRKAYMEELRVEAELNHQKELHKAQIDFAADKRISNNLKYIIQTQSKSLNELERKYDIQQATLIECVSDRASLRTQVNILQEEVEELKGRLNDR
jgi:predicted transcriptional regulator